jgi:hypothetical protein
MTEEPRTAISARHVDLFDYQRIVREALLVVDSRGGAGQVPAAAERVATL